MKATLDRSDGEMEPAARSEDHTGPGRHESYQSPWRTTWAWQGKGGGGAADENPEAGAVVMVEEGEEEAETTVEGEEGNRL